MIHTIEYDYPAFHLSMDCFLAKVKAGSLTLKEAQASRWLTRSELYEVQWLPADISLIEILEVANIFVGSSMSSQMIAAATRIVFICISHVYSACISLIEILENILK